MLWIITNKYFRKLALYSQRKRDFFQTLKKSVLMRNHVSSVSVLRDENLKPYKVNEKSKLTNPCQTLLLFRHPAFSTVTNENSKTAFVFWPGDHYNLFTMETTGWYSTDLIPRSLGQPFRLYSLRLLARGDLMLMCQPIQWLQWLISYFRSFSLFKIKTDWTKQLRALSAISSSEKRIIRN